MLEGPVHRQWCLPGATGPASYKKWADQPSGSKTFSIVLCISSWPQVPDLLEFLSWLSLVIHQCMEVSAKKTLSSPTCFRPWCFITEIYSNPNEDNHHVHPVFYFWGGLWGSELKMYTTSTIFLERSPCTFRTVCNGHVTLSSAPGWPILCITSSFCIDTELITQYEPGPQYSHTVISANLAFAIVPNFKLFRIYFNRDFGSVCFL